MAISISIPTELSVTVVKILQENLRYFQELILEPIPLTLICCPWVPCPPLEPEGGVSLTGTIEREWRCGLFQRKINVLLAEPESDGFWAGKHRRPLSVIWLMSTDMYFSSILLYVLASISTSICGEDKFPSVDTGMGSCILHSFGS